MLKVGSKGGQGGVCLGLGVGMLKLSLSLSALRAYMGVSVYVCNYGGMLVNVCVCVCR